MANPILQVHEIKKTSILCLTQVYTMTIEGQSHDSDAVTSYRDYGASTLH